MNPMKLKTGELHGVRVANQAMGCQMPVFHRGMNPAVDPFRSTPDSNRGYPSRRRLAILPRQTILSRWSLAAGHACLEATHNPETLNRAEVLSVRQGLGKATGQPSTETTITGA